MKWLENKKSTYTRLKRVYYQLSKEHGQSVLIEICLQITNSHGKAASFKIHDYNQLQ
jgi:hypothetical protein